jgi:mRNA-degrading endonuclease RelE of RelBE toxin-antitoxin system
MEFRIADTFTESLARLTGEEQKAVKTTAFDLQLNPANPGMSFHKLDKAKDRNFWSVRVGSDIRLIVHKTQGSLLLCYADHHAMQTTMTKPTTGRSGGSWKRIPKREPRSWLRFGRQCANSSCQFMYTQNFRWQASHSFSLKYPMINY